VDGTWELTDLGRHLRDVDQRGLPERPRVLARWTDPIVPSRR
jgi:hypothetical protein